MSDVTVRQLAEVVGIRLERLLAQLGDAGLAKSGADDVLSDTEKLQLLSHLRQSHGKVIGDAAEPKRVTLQRRTVSELKQGKVPGTDVKTISVEVRKKRTYDKRSRLTGSSERRREIENARQVMEQQHQEKQSLELIQTDAANQSATGLPPKVAPTRMNVVYWEEGRLTSESGPAPVIRDEVFISYSHKDKEWLDKLQTMLVPLTRKGHKIWADTDINPGAEWKKVI